VTPPNGTVPATLTVSANITGIAVGNYTGTIAITASNVANSPLNIPAELHVRGSTPVTGAPAISPDGVQNAGGYQNKLAPGAVFVIKGSNLGPASIAVASGPNFPFALAGSSVTFTPVAGGAAIDA